MLHAPTELVARSFCRRRQPGAATSGTLAAAAAAEAQPLHDCSHSCLFACPNTLAGPPMKGGSDVEEGCTVSVSTGSSPPGSANTTPRPAEAAAAAAMDMDAHYWEDAIFKGQDPGKEIRSVWFNV